MAYLLPSDPAVDLDTYPDADLCDLYARLTRFLRGVSAHDLSTETLGVLIADQIAVQVATRRRGIVLDLRGAA